MGKKKNSLCDFFKLNCENTSPLISEMMDHRVSLIKRVKIKIHLAMCEVCLYYKKQLEIIRNLAKNLGREDFPANKDQTLSQESKEKIKKMLETDK